MSEENRKVVKFTKYKKKSFKSEFKDFLEFLIDDIRYGTGRIFLALIILCILVIAVMLLNRLRAHTTVDIDNRLNDVYEQAEMYNDSDMGEYESFIPDDIRNEAASNNITVEEQLEKTYNTGFAKYITALTIMTVFAVVLSMARR